MIGRVTTVAAIGLVLTIQPAFAHPPPFGLNGFSGGVLHPLLFPAHVLVLLALGMLIGGQITWTLRPLVGFAVGMSAGLGLIASGIVPRFMTEAVTSLAIVASLLVILARPIPETAGSVLAVLVGAAIALDSPPETVSISEANRMLVGIGVGALSLSMAAIWLTRCRNSQRSRIVPRVLGSWIAASAILFLALRLVR